MNRTREITRLNELELEKGLIDKASWHDEFKDTCYIYVGGLSFEVTEGDLLCIFAQYGTLIDCHLVRDKETGESKGFAFLAYENQKSTVLAVDNLNGIELLGRTLRVDHTRYKEQEGDEERRLAFLKSQKKQRKEKKKKKKRKRDEDDTE